MRIGYIRADNKMGAAPQREALVASGIPDKPNNIFVEQGNGTTLDWVIARKMRPSHRDTIEVSDLHRLASTTAGISDAIERISDQKGTVIEVRSGARSDQPGPFSRAFAASSAYLAGRGPRPDLSKIGQLVAKRKDGSATLHDIERIMNDHTLTVAAAVAKINAKYRIGISTSTLYRRRRKGKVKFEPRLMGRPSKDE